jgi:CheY-like chemotaxis protein
MDHMMPEMDGIEAVKIIREEIGSEYARNIPIIALTANAIVGNEQMFLSKGFQAFLSKPVEIANLDLVIHQWVRDKKNDPGEWKAEIIERREGGVDRRKNIRRQQVQGTGSYKIDGIDLNKGLQYFGDDEDAFLNVLRSYAVNTRPLLDTIKIATKESDGSSLNLNKYAITVHGIKGSSYGICAQSAGKKAEELEHAAKAGDMDFVKNNNEDFIKLIEKLLLDLENMLGRIDEKNIKQKKEKPDREALMKLLDACRNYELDKIDSVLAELQGFEYEADSELVPWLLENVKQVNLMEMIEKLETFLN